MKATGGEVQINTSFGGKLPLPRLTHQKMGYKTTACSHPIMAIPQEPGFVDLDFRCTRAACKLPVLVIDQEFRYEVVLHLLSIHPRWRSFNIVLGA